jgi:hypothetical protein
VATTPRFWNCVRNESIDDLLCGHTANADGRIRSANTIRCSAKRMFDAMRGRKPAA